MIITFGDRDEDHRPSHENPLFLSFFLLPFPLSLSLLLQGWWTSAKHEALII